MRWASLRVGLQAGCRDETRSLPNMEAALAAHGIRTLTNRSVLLTVDGAPLQVVGAGDTHLGLCDLDAAFQDVDPAVFTILAAHNPDTAFRLERRRVDLTLSGHTHGGQISIPCFGPLTLRTRYHLPPAFLLLLCTCTDVHWLYLQAWARWACRCASTLRRMWFPYAWFGLAAPDSWSSAS